MIIFDFETTGLDKANVVNVSQQPKAIEFAAIKLDDKTLEEKDRCNFLINPNERLDPKITKLTGIKDSDLIDQKPFSYYYPRITQMFFGEKYAVAHNVAFDINILKYELIRIGKLTQFPFSPIHICTVNQTFKIRNYRLKLSDLYSHLFGEIMPKGHRAIVDVEALTRITKELISTNFIKIT
jgi:DNA polymerase III epsilon subunit-like protein